MDEAGVDQGWRGVITDITMEHDAQSRMQQLALVDSLTGLANRTQLRDKLQLKLDCAARKPAALLCLNMDHFKRVNDMFGHAAGDLVLRETARRLRKLVRASDVVARAGGDEFAIAAGRHRRRGRRTALRPARRRRARPRLLERLRPDQQRRERRRGDDSRRTARPWTSCWPTPTSR